MDLENLLAEKRSGIIKKWFALIADTYSVEMSKFMKKKKNRFADPVGYTASTQIEAIFDALHRQAEPDELSACLDKIIRIRAVQDFSPSAALDFIFLLKQVIRAELDEEVQDKRISEELLELESRIDDLALLAFDVYMSCREKVHKIKIKELQMNRLDLITGHGPRRGTMSKKPGAGGS
ncbi:MAG: RsbRD N-terminal domain-containing protein [Deltaproteobacteria bacterium]|nr:RsbRD N-terminal domain-containing protein [Deltaproteobacteria bacterium]